jgi:hypothetical protein
LVSSTVESVDVGHSIRSPQQVAGSTDLQELVQELSSSKSDKRSSAAKRLRKQKHTAAAPAILDALKKELSDDRTWKAKFEMILAIGELHDHAALPFLWELTKIDTPHTIVYIALGDAIVRLSCKEKSDVDCIFQIANTRNVSLLNGAFNAMSELRLIPNDEQIGRILELAEDPRAENNRYPNDRVGLRLNVALAAAGWPRDLVRPFLDRCLAIPDKGLQLAASNSLKGKYTKWASL